MSEKKEQTRRVREVVISGNIEGYDAASVEELKKLIDRVEDLRGQIAALKRLVGNLQMAINTTNMRFERLEKLFKSFK